MLEAQATLQLLMLCSSEDERHAKIAGNTPEFGAQPQELEALLPQSNLDMKTKGHDLAKKTLNYVI